MQYRTWSSYHQLLVTVICGGQGSIVEQGCGSGSRKDPYSEYGSESRRGSEIFSLKMWYSEPQDPDQDPKRFAKETFFRLFNAEQ
jgi:hypothetical protein